VNLWTVGCAGASLTAQARSPVGGGCPEASQRHRNIKGLNLTPGEVKPSAGDQPSLFFQTTGTTAHMILRVRAA
jgi:hypothetical protein